MQYFSGVWQSLTGHSIVKRKRSEDETAALPDRMTSLKLHADQNPGTYHRATSSANHPARSCDVDSSIASGSHFQASDCCLHNSNSSFNQYNQNSLLDHAHSSQFPATGLWTHAIPQSAGARTTASYTASLGNTVNLQQGSLSNDAIPHSMYTQVPAESSQHTGLRPYRLAAPKQTSSNTQQQTSNTQHQQLTTRSTAHPLPEATAEADLHSLESFSPVDRHDIPSQPSLYSPDMALSESVADSPDDIELLEDEVMQTNSPFAKHSTATAFLAVCQSPQVITALSKLHACKDLPSGCIMLPLPTSAQHCGIAMASELSSAASAQASWNTASQLAWTIAAMFALCQRAKLCEQELDAMMLLSILWILECCSSQVDSTVPVVTSRYLDYICRKAAAAGPHSPPQVRVWQNDLKAAQMEVLKKCNWRVHLDFETDLTSALHQLQQVQDNTQLHSIVRDVQASSKRRGELQTQMTARAAQSALQAHHVQLQQQQQQQQMGTAACCQSSTKPARPSARRQHTDTHAVANHARLRQQAEDLSYSNLNGKYWQTTHTSSYSSHTATNSSMSGNQRTRYSNARAKTARQQH